jgi:hypothetical protein
MEIHWHVNMKRVKRSRENVMVSSVWNIFESTSRLALVALSKTKSRVLNEISGMAILVPILCWNWNLVSFW